MTGLTDFQSDVARTFFGLPAAKGFLLAGGGALLATGLTERATEDLDFFGEQGRCDVELAAAQLEAAAARRGWATSRIQSGPTFVRLRLIGAEPLLADFAIDSSAIQPPTITFVGPTFSPEELAGRKLTALFGRAEARDFADVYVLAQRFDKRTLLLRAREVDPGFDHAVLAEMFDSLDRFDNEEIPVRSDQVLDVRSFFRAWATELRR